MRKRGWFFWFAVVTASFATLVGASFYLLIRSLGGTAPTVTEGSALAVDLALDYPDAPLYELSGLFLDLESMTFRELILAIERAQEDARIESLFLHVRGTGLGWAHVTELRRQLVDFRDSDKPLVAFVEYASNRDYYLASAADEIYIHPRTILDLRGVRAEATFFGTALEKLGIEPEFERVGTYKDAPDVFERDELSPESREVLEMLVLNIRDVLVEGMVQGRGLDEERAREILASGPFTAQEAKELGLVDELGYYDEVEKRLALAPDGESPSVRELDPEEAEEVETISASGYRAATRSRSSFGADARIALIYGIGAIVGGSSAEDSLFGRVMGSDTIAEAFEKVREDESIDAVVFRIESPGGSDVASDVIWREAMLTREKKPVIVSMGDVAASGGYWIATASDAIVAEPTTITGSIGIFGGKFNLAGLYEKLGIGTDGVGTSENADFFSSSRSFSPEERARLRAILESGYLAFLERVAEARNMSIAEADAVAQGRVWTGEKALEIGLVDELGGLERALVLAKEEAGFDADDSVELRIYPEKRSILELFLSGFMTGSRGFRIEDAEALLERSPFLRSLSEGAGLALLPLQIRIE